MIFRNRQSESNTIPCPSGEKEETTFTMTIDKEGHKSIKIDGKTNIYERIQSHAEECDIYNILNRAMNGDQTALNARSGQYIDTIGMPKTLAEAQQLIINIRHDFEKLPKEERLKYNNSPEEYVAHFEDNVIKEAAAVAAAKEEEVNKNEQEQ